MSGINIVVAELIIPGKTPVKFEIGADPTVRNLLSNAGVSPDRVTFMLNNNFVGLDAILEDGDRVIVASNTKGNTPYVLELVRPSVAPVRVTAEEGTTLDAILRGNLSREVFNTLLDPKDTSRFGGEFRIISQGSSLVSPDAVIRRPDNGEVRVLFTVKTKGNK